MKKLGLFIVSLVLIGCSYGEALLEEQEIQDGKVFSIEQGCVQYAEGVQFFFDQYGKRQRFDLLSQRIKVDDSTSYTVDVSIIYKDSVFYLICDSLGYFTPMQSEDICDYMMVSVQEYILWDADYTLSKVNSKTLGNLQVDVLYNHTTRHRVMSYGRVRLTESNYESTFFEDKLVRELHNLNAQHFYTRISDVTDKDPFDFGQLQTFDTWKGKRIEWTQEEIILYYTLLYLTDGFSSNL